MKITIAKAQNIGTTFIGLIATAFDVEDCRDIQIPANLQDPRHGMGTIYIGETAYDWFDRGDSVEFLPA